MLISVCLCIRIHKQEMMGSQIFHKSCRSNFQLGESEGSKPLSFILAAREARLCDSVGEVLGPHIVYDLKR